MRLRKKAKEQHDSKACKLVELRPGAVVRVQHHHTKRWDLIGTIMEVKPRERSYLVRTETGRLYWKNTKFIGPYFPSEEDKDIDPKRASSETGKEDNGQGLRRSKRDRRGPDRYKPGAYN